MQGKQKILHQKKIRSKKLMDTTSAILISNAAYIDHMTFL
jgi:hypothetical protein